ncbi:MAG: N-acetylmuramoyl-L-alanine amidase [Pseudomonadota bacterium]
MILFRISIFHILLFLGILIHVSFAHALEIKKVRFGEHPDKLRTVIELDQETEFKVFTLPKLENKPYRIVVDVPRFNWNAGNINLPKRNHVTDVRTGTVNNDIMRVVIDMAKPTTLKTAFILPKSGSNPVRLVIDSQSVSSSAFESKGKKTIGDLNVPAKSLDTIVAEQSGSNSHKINPIEALKERVGTIIPPKKPAYTTSTSGSTQSPLRKPLIVIDAGHGGADPGAIGANKMKEKDITLSAAKILKRHLESTGRYRASLTRDTDKYLKLYQRVAIARKKEADLFISIHADSINRSNVRGASIYTLSNTASDKQTAKLAARENQADLIAGVDLSHEDKEVANILIDLAMRDTMNQSKFFANTVVDIMNQKGLRTLTKPHRYAGFAVLKAPDTPSVLLEIGFMSNKQEANLLATNDYQKKIAKVLSESLDIYFSKVRKNAP